MEIDLLLEFTERSELRKWLLENHASARSCWVTCSRSRRPGTLYYPDLVEEALCFGWIDSTCKRLPDGRLAQRISPRRKGSHWTELNRRRCADLSARGLMTAAGLAAVRAGLVAPAAGNAGPATPSLPTKEVVAAIIRRGDEVLATQRGYGDWKDWWEFPGGKIEAGESPEAALVREIREELAAEISVDRLLHTIEWDYPTFHLRMHCYMCSLLGDALHLNEHEAARWLSAADLPSVSWLPADLQLLPLIERELCGCQQTSERVEPR